MTKFTDLGLSQPLLDALAAKNYVVPTPIQAQSIPTVLTGRDLLGIVLAHAELVAHRRGAPPILLLDEVAAHLDPARRAALFGRLEGRGQVWMTATEPELFAEIGASASRFHVVSGTISVA